MEWLLSCRCYGKAKNEAAAERTLVYRLLPGKKVVAVNAERP